VEGGYPDADLLIWQAHLFALTPCGAQKMAWVWQGSVKSCV
jgi:hypothetical protein